MFVVYDAGRFVLPSLTSHTIRWQDGTSSGKRMIVQQIEQLPPGFEISTEPLPEEVLAEYPEAKWAVIIDIDAVLGWAANIGHELRPKGS